MSKPRDDNQRLQEGDLKQGADPEENTEPVGADGKPNALAKHWLTLAEAGITFTDPPRARRWLLKLGDEGALPLGKAGVLAAGGGTGKTMALVQLALAVATGGFWLGSFKATAPGNVLIALAEEDKEEIQRRLYRAACAIEMDRDARSAAAKRIVALPLAGTPVALTCKDKEGNTTESPLLGDLRTLLTDRDWSLIILDPLARFAGDDVEKDNAAATRFVQAVESLVQSRGTPTVLVAHHSSAQSKSDGESNVRGVTAIVDGFRWAAVLDSRTGELGGETIRGARLRLKKTNYTRGFDDVYLVRSTAEDSAGSFMQASDAQRQTLEGAETKSAAEAKRGKAKPEATTKVKDETPLY